MKTLRTLIPIVMAGALLGCDSSEQSKIQLPDPGATADPVVEVDTLRVARGETNAPLIITGTSRAARAADLAPAMTARIERILVSEGDRVKRGQPLVRLDARTAKLGATQAAAAATAAKAQADQLEADHKRLAPLAERGSIPRSRLDQLDSQRDAAQAQARAAAAAADAAARVAENAVLRAPFAGLVADVPVEVGEMSSMAPGAKLVRLVDLSSVEVTVPLPERDLGRVALGDQVIARFPSLSREAEGEIVHIGFEIDANTRTAEVVARMPNPDESLRAGLFTQISIAPSSSRDAIVIPKTAVAGPAGSRYVYVVTGDTVARRPVRTAEFNRSHEEIIDGLSDGDVIVTDQIGRLSEGARVSARSDSERASAPALDTASNPSASVAETGTATEIGTPSEEKSQ